jgi:ribose transport system ATP-binding protein
VLKRFRSQGMALLYISHRMHEIAEIADECTVFRNGRNVATYKAGTRSETEVVEMMIGREYKNVFPPKPVNVSRPEPPVLECRDLGWDDRLRNISLTVGEGEVVGLGGLDGQGQRDLLLALFGVLRGITGEILIDGKPQSIASPTKACDESIGMALIPEDRKTEGLMLPMTVRENLSFAALDRVARRGIIDRDKEEQLIGEMVRLLTIKTAGLDIPVGALSGGNQQKVVIAKSLVQTPKLIIFDEPTRGVDVGAIAEIHQFINQLAEEGLAVVVISSYLPEIMNLSDRILVTRQGRVVEEFTAREATEERIMYAAVH